MPRFIKKKKKSFFERPAIVLAVCGAVGGGEGKNREKKEREVPVASAKRCALALSLLNKLSTFWFFTC